MTIYFGAVAAVLVLVHVTFLFAVKTKRNDLADVIWGPGFLFATAGALCFKWFDRQSLDLGFREVLILSFLAIWAIRLFAHIGWRGLQKKEEDVRYRQMRQNWGSSWIWRTYLYVFILQGALILVVAIGALRAIEVSPRAFSEWFYVGTLLWLAGFLFEAISDHQLSRFKSNPKNKGQIMNQGLWSWSRHPNYFGEVVQWWGLFLMAADVNSWWIVISPMTISFLILKVSGVPLLEELMRSRPGYEQYKRQTSIFFPKPPRK